VGLRVFSQVGRVNAYGLLECDSVDVESLPYGVYDLPSFGCVTTCFGCGDETNLDPGHRLISRAKLCCDEREVGATIVSPVCRLPWVCRKCSHNLHNALCNRHGVRQPPVTYDFAPAHRAIEALLPRVMMEYGSQFVHWQHEWISKWPRCKRALIERSVRDDPLMPNVVLCMVKREHAHKRPRPRNIQYYYNLHTQAYLGPEFYSLQKAWGQVLSMEEECVVDGIWLTAASGMTSVGLGEWMTRVHTRFANPRFYESDGKNWDSCMSSEHFALRRLAYSRMPLEFRNFVERGIKVRGVARTKTSRMVYSLNGTNKSGHNDTYLFNVIVNLMIAFLACRAIGLRAAIIALGDDKVIAVDGDFDGAQIAAIERSCGIVPVWRQFASWRDVSFISGCWWRNRGGFVFTPKPGRLLARLWSTTTPPRPSELDSYLGGVAAGLAPTCLGLPVVRALIRGHLSKNAGWNDKKYGYMCNVGVVWDESILEQFAERYGVTAEAVLSLERTLDALSGVQCLLVEPTAEAIMAVDLADPTERPTHPNSQ